MDNAIEVRDLTKSYGQLLAVDHIHFEVRRGEIFGFLGPNRAGKTTTQRMLTTLLAPTAGRILINRAVLGAGYLSRWLDLALLPLLLFVFLIPAAWLHQRGRVLGR